jgi:hypothetical protein
LLFSNLAVVVGMVCEKTNLIINWLTVENKNSMERFTIAKYSHPRFTLLAEVRLNFMQFYIRLRKVQVEE